MQFIVDTDNEEINIISGFTKEEFVETMNKLPIEWQEWYIEIIHAQPDNCTCPNQLEFDFKGTIPTVNQPDIKD